VASGGYSYACDFLIQGTNVYIPGDQEVVNGNTNWLSPQAVFGRAVAWFRRSVHFGPIAVDDIGGGADEDGAVESQLAVRFRNVDAPYCVDAIRDRY